jgi:hypothetical protein
MKARCGRLVGAVVWVMVTIVTTILVMILVNGISRAATCCAVRGRGVHLQMPHLIQGMPRESPS